MTQYHKIQTAWLRNPETNFKEVLEGQWALPEFELLKDIDWLWTEKIDGTNIRVIFDGETVVFKGKTDNADIPKHLLTTLQILFPLDKMKTAFPEATNVCLYGEGYGCKIQKGGNYLPDTTDFILFDCKIDNWWLEFSNVIDISLNLSINVVPIIGRGILTEAIELVRNGFKSVIAKNTDYIAEGLVMKPRVELFDRRGNRIVTKIKHKDFVK
jgi:hypothetical protein